jgi:pimeloyl-ACP methyl ester carboxylesterase
MIKPIKINLVSNKIKLNAYFYEGIGKGTKPTLIWLHGIPGGREEGKSEMSINLCKSGINVLRFNYQGIWGNKGEFTMSNSLKDLTSAMDYLTGKENIGKLKIDTNRIVLAGYSYGTAIALVGALYDERIKNIICIATCDYSYFGRQFIDPYSKLREVLEDAVEGVLSDKTILKQDPYLFLKNLSDNISKYDIVKHSEKLLSKKIFMISGIDDNVCPVEDHLLPVYRRLRKLDHKNLKLIINKCGHEPPPDLQELIYGWIKESL